MRRGAGVALIGRQQQRDALRAALEAAIEGAAPSLVLVRGEAGIGKTRLLDDLAAGARERGAMVLRGDCVDLGPNELPYAPLVAALRRVDEARLQRAVADLGLAAAAELGRLLPTLDAAPAAPNHGELAQTRLFELLLLLLGRLGADRPVLLALEDVHWADGATRGFLAFLARSMSTERLLAIATYRTEAVFREHPLRRLLSELVRLRTVERIELEGLEADEVALQVQHLIERVPDRELVAELARRSGGNPFVVEELVAGSGGPGDLPDTLSEALLVHVEELSPRARAIVAALAVVGRPARSSLLERLTGGHPREVTAALREAVERNVVVVDDRDGAVHFRHALMRDAVYADLLPGERIALHRATLEALREDGEPPPAELAHHAAAADVPAEALATSVAAGRAAAGIYAYAEAASHFERALALWDRVPGAQDRVDVLAGAAEAHRYAGDHERAIARCREALAGIDRATEPLRAAVLLERLGQYHYDDDEVPLACYDEALELLPEHPPTPERARILAARGTALLGNSRVEEARAACEAAVEVAAGCGAQREESAARATLGLALGFLGDADEGERQLRIGLALAEELGRDEDVVRIQLYRSELLRLGGHVAGALTIMVEAERVAGRSGVPRSFAPFIAAQIADDLFALGRWHEAAQRLERLVGADTGGAGLIRASVAARLAAARGDEPAARSVDAMRELAERESPPAELLPGMYAAPVESHLWRGDPATAAALATEGLRLVGARGDPHNTPLLHWLGARAEADLAERARLSGDAVSATAACERAGALLAGADGLVADGRPAVGEALRRLAGAEVGRAAGADALEEWAAAAATWQALGQPYPLAYACWRQAEALLGAGRREAGREALQRAYETIEPLGADPLEREIRGLARRARIDLGTAPRRDEPRVSAAGGVHMLTAREAEVLALLADGLTNRQIGERLYIAGKTVGVHVSRILGKLNARNRVEAAGIAHRMGLLDGAREDP